MQCLCSDMFTWSTRYECLMRNVLLCGRNVFLLYQRFLLMNKPGQLIQSLLNATDCGHLSVMKQQETAFRKNCLYLRVKVNGVMVKTPIKVKRFTGFKCEYGFFRKGVGAGRRMSAGGEIERWLEPGPRGCYSNFEEMLKRIQTNWGSLRRLDGFNRWVMFMRGGWDLTLIGWRANGRHVDGGDGSEENESGKCRKKRRLGCRRKMDRGGTRWPILVQNPEWAVQNWLVVDALGRNRRGDCSPIEVSISSKRGELTNQCLHGALQCRNCRMRR